MKIKSLLKHNLMRAAMTLALILACAAAWAQDDVEFTLGTPQPFYFTGNQIKPSVTRVTIGNTVYEEFQFTVTYGTNINSGENSCVIYVTITAEGHHQGFSFTKTYPIKKRPLTVNIPNCEKHYGADDPAFTWQLVWDEAVQQDSINNLRDVWLPQRLNGHLTRTAGETMGDYTISYEGVNPIEFANYLVTVNPGTLTITAPNPDDFSVNADSTEYTIHTATGWNFFCDALQDNATWNRFSGKTVKLGADITVTRMAGSSYHDFMGTFDGQGHTLTVDYGSAESPITADNAAPFVNVESGCIIENLHVAGDIYTSGKNAAGIAGTQYGAVTIRNCRVSTAIHSYTIGDGTHGGLVGNNGNGNGSALNIEGCVFDGKLLTEGETATNKCGGFVGWCHKEVTISNSLFAPTEVTIGTTSSATFARNGATITNCYYTTDFNDGEHFTAQGKQARSITAGDYVTVENAGENAGTATTYSTSGITSYGTGILYDNVLYAGNGDEVSLTLSNSIGGDVPEGYQYAYSTNAGTLDGSTLTMPDANVIVSVSTALRSTGQPVSITYNYYGGYNLTHDAIALDGTESSLGESGQETWYFVGTDISHSGTITCSGNVNIILADGKTMTITSSDGHGIDVNNFLTIYGQELGTGTLNAIINNSIGIYSYTGNITIRGGQVTATMSGSFGDGINTRYGSVTIYGGQVTATGNTTPGNSGICAFTGSVTINGGQVTATGSSGIYTDSGSVTINGGQVTANGNFSGIQANGSVTINGGQVTATGDVGIFTQSGGSVTINGGQVSAIGNNYGICAEDSNNITLGWTTASDYIYANTYYADYDYAEGTLSIAEGKAFIDEDGNIYSGTIAQVDQAYAIDGKTLYPYIEGSVPYIDENGQRQLCTDYNVLNGTETSLGTSGQETWYVADGTLNYGQTITLSGNVHLILKDNAVMNVGTQSTITYGIGDGSSTASISIYGQSTGNSQGQLHVNVSAFGICAKDGNLTINGGEVVVTSSYSLGIFANGGNITINGGEVEATGNNTNGEGIFATKNSSGNGGSISISNATVTANGSIGIQANSGITINSGTVTTNNCNYGIYASSCSLTINGGQVTANGSTYGIYAEGGNVTISGGQVTANGSTYDIYATYGNITISGGQVTANGSTYGIYAEGGNVNISGGEVEATGNNTNGNGGGILAIKSSSGNGGSISISNATVTATGYIGIRAQSGITINSGTVTANNCNYGIYADVSNLTISGGQVTANGNSCGIFGDNITITSGEVTANGPYGIYADNGNLIISGGQVTANGNSCGIFGDNITLGWTNPTDFIYVNKYYTYGTLSIADGKTFIDEAGQTYSGPVAMVSGAYPIDGKRLYPYIEGSVPYIDENGQRQLCTEYTSLTGTETTLGTAGQETWYVVQGTLNYSEGIQLWGNTHIILADGKTMTITSSDDNGIIVSSSLTIYGQELGTGTLNATGNNGIYSDSGDITIIGGTLNATGNNGIYSVSGDITIIGGTLNATGNDGKGIYSSGDITIIGGTLNATGNDGKGIYSSGDITIIGGTLNATGNENGIHSYSGNITISGGTVTATDNSTGYGIFTHSGNITISGGRVTATSENGHGIYSYDGTTTLGWTNATDFIYVSRYYIGTSGTLNIAEGKAFIDEAGNTFESGSVEASAINGKWLYPNTVSLFTKIIAAHHTVEGVNYGWYLIASPLSGETNAEAVAHLVNSETPANFDLYRFNQAADLEWENWKQQNSDHYHFNLELGRGYLYANAAEVKLVFAGTPYSGNGEVTLQKTEGAELSGWNLVGNPFTVSATLTQPYYRMNAEGSALKTETETTAVAAMEGVFVQATAANQTVTFTAQRRGGEKAAIAQANIMVGGDNGAVIDNAIIRFDGGQTLEKFSFREGSTKLYIPQDGKDYAIACAESTGEMPVNFKAETDGTYTISVNVDNVEMGYLHLIDNMTGSDIDLLAMNNGDARPCVSTYTFTAKTTDYESRFKLVFAVGSSTGSDTFAFFSNGNWIVSNEGHATLQVIDVNGRILISEQINGSISKAINQPAGVYMLRLVKGENVRTQKIVVE